MAPDTIPDFDQLDAVTEPSWTFRLDGREWHTIEFGGDAT